jgi:hypothetical protein
LGAEKNTECENQKIFAHGRERYELGTSIAIRKVSKRIEGLFASLGG